MSASLTTTVNDIEHIESQSLNGIAVIKVYFQPGAKIEMAVAQVTSVSQAVLRQLPVGITPPLVITFNASSVPLIQLGLSSDKLAEQDLNDIALNFLRTRLVTIPGAAIPYPFGGKSRQVMVDIDPSRLAALGLSPTDVVNAISVQNLILPSGTAKIGSTEFDIEPNGSPMSIAELNDLPVKAVNGDDCLPQGRGQRARRLRRADQHRASRRPTLGAGLGLQERQRLHPEHRRQRPRGAARHRRQPAGRSQDCPALRSIGLRARVHQRRGQGGGHRRRC